MDQQQVAAIDLVHDAAKEARALAETNLELADRLLRVASALHDQAHAPTLRSVS
jgi:hypothetical protein